MKQESGQARTILGLYQEKKADGIVITIRGDGKLGRHASFYLNDPPRLIIDFPGVSFPDGPDAYRCADDAIRRVRIGRSKPDRTRIVFDFAGPTGIPHIISQEGPNLAIEFVTRKEENSTPLVRIVKPVDDIVVSEGTTVSFAGVVTGGNEPIASHWTVAGNGINQTTLQLDALKFDQPGTYSITYYASDRDKEWSSASVRITVTGTTAATVPPRSTAVEDRTADPRRKAFSLSFGDMLYHAGSVKDLTIQKSMGGVTNTWELSRRDRLMLTIGADYELKPWLALGMGLSGNVDYEGTTLVFLSAGPKISLPMDGGPSPYLRAGLTYGHLRWDGVPGDFDNGIGWEFGYGLSIPYRAWKIGIDMGYRDIRFDYNRPDSPYVSANNDEMDFSGYSAALLFQFPL